VGSSLGGALLLELLQLRLWRGPAVLVPSINCTITVACLWMIICSD
jgi:hypothetical protein